MFILVIMYNSLVFLFLLAEQLFFFIVSHSTMRRLSTSILSKYIVILGCLLYGTLIMAQYSASYFNSELSSTVDTSSVILTSGSSVLEAVTDYFVITEDDNTFVFNPVSNDLDTTDRILSLTSIYHATLGTITAVNGNLVSYTPTPNAHGTDVLTYIIHNDLEYSDTGTVEISIVAINETPTANDTTIITNLNQRKLLDITSNDVDIDHSGLTIISTTHAQNGVVLLVDSDYYYTPNTAYFGLDSFQYTIADGEGDMSTAWVFIQVNFVNISFPTAVDDTIYATTFEFTPFDPLFNDYDSYNDILTYVPGDKPTNGIVLLLYDVLNYRSDEAFVGVDSMNYAVADYAGSLDTGTVYFIVSVDGQIPLAEDEHYVTPEDISFIVVPSINADAALEDLVPLDIAVLDPPDHGTVTVIGGDLRYTPTEDYWGLDTFTYIATDANDGRSDIAVVSIDILSVNDDPEIINFNVTLYEDDTDTLDVLPFAIDHDNSGISLGAVLPSTSATAWIFDEKIVYQPNADFFGLDTLSFYIVDGEGDIGVAYVYYNVLPVPELPPSLELYVSTGENITVNFIVPTESSEDPKLLNLLVEQAPLLGSYTNNGLNVSYTPNSNVWGLDTIIYCVIDARGTCLNTANIFITINEVLVQPILSDIHIIIDEDSQGTLNVFDSLLELGSEPLFLSDVKDGLNVTGQIQDSTILIIPNENFYGDDSLSYILSTSNSEVYYQSTIYVDVLSVNDAPVAVVDSFLITDLEVEDGADIILLVAANDYDVDEIPIQGDLEIIQTPLHGTLNTDIPLSVVYTLDDNFAGVDSFIYVLRDTLGAESNQATVYITVDIYNFDPIAVNDTIYLSEDSEFSFNPIDNDFDVQNDSLWASLADVNTLHGLIDTSDFSNWIYQPEVDFYGQDSVMYTCNDAKGGQAQAWILITITPENDSTLLINPDKTFYYAENSGWQLVAENVLFTDIDNDTLVKVELFFDADTLGTWDLDFVQAVTNITKDTSDQVVHLTMYNTDNSLFDWQNIISSLQYRNTAHSDTSLNTVTINLWDSDTTFSKEILAYIIPQYINEAPINVELPSLSGFALFDSTLTCYTGEWSDTDGNISYDFNWYYSFNDLETQITTDLGATLLLSDEVAEADAIWCQVIATDDGFPLPAQQTIAFSDTISPPNYRPSALDISSNTVYLSMLPGDTIGLLTATDRDTDQSHIFELMSGLNVFSITDNMLTISVEANSLDIQQITLSIRVIDNGNPTQYRDFDVRLVFVNDFMPLIQSGYPKLVLVTADSVEVDILTDKPGYALYTVVKAGVDVPFTPDNFNDSLPFNALESVVLPKGDLESETAYDMVIYAVDTLGLNKSGPYHVFFTTLDITGPVFVESTPFSIYCGVDSMAVALKLNEVGAVYFTSVDSSVMSLPDSLVIQDILDDGSSLYLHDTSRLFFAEIPDIEVKETHTIAFVAQDPSGNFSEVTYYQCSPIDSIPSQWIDNYPVLHGVYDGSVVYSVYFTECGTVLSRICDNFTDVSDFITPDDKCIHESEILTDDNCALTIETEQLPLDGVYRLDVALMDPGGNISEVRSLSFEYPVAFRAELEYPIVFYGENIQLRMLTDNTDYTIVNVNGVVVQTGSLTYADTYIPFHHETAGVFLIQFHSESGNSVLRFMKSSSTRLN